VPSDAMTDGGHGGAAQALSSPLPSCGHRDRPQGAPTFWYPTRDRTNCELIERGAING